jgi:hypothetical protein
VIGIGVAITLAVLANAYDGAPKYALTALAVIYLIYNVWPERRARHPSTVRARSRRERK